MALKTFNVDAEVYRKFSEHCKSEGMSMSKKVERFMKEELERLTLKSVSKKTNEKEHPFKKYC